ncbi:sensor histidine kinase [Paenibacillus sp. TAF43_2]|uniref:sensor histidine kinase n=1 Tax=Paenibacillus sp. TAF43_2 TaxID=3233069 RepID=UPI003F9A1177
MFKELVSYTTKYRLSFRMILTNICIAVLPILLLGTVGYFSYINILKKNALDNINIFVTQTNNRFDEYFYRMDQLSKSIFFNRNVQSIMLENKSWQESDILLRNLNSYLSLEPALKSIGMISSEDFRLVSTGELLMHPMVTYLKEMENENRLSNKLQISPPFSKDQGILAFRKVKSVLPNRYLQEIYIGVLLLDTEWIQQILRSADLADKAELYIMNESGDLIGSSTNNPDFEQIYAQTRTNQDHKVIDFQMNGINYLYQSLPIKSLGWKFVALINEDKLVGKASIIQYIVISAIAIMVLIVIWVAISFNIRLTHPITKMADIFDSAASGDLDARLRFGYKNEITIIQDHYNNMMNEIKKLTDNLLQSQQQLYETEMEKRMFQLNGLQSQINSHFLYNVLHSIRGMALSNAKREVAVAIDNLVSYFRYITRTDEFVLLHKELDHLERYIDIQKIRFGERLQFKVIIDQGLGARSIVKLILQPLVENALFHGLEGKTGRWIIHIHATIKEENQLLIKVMDNGVGMSEERLMRMRQEFESMNKNSSETAGLGQGIGLVNIHKRIQIYYGKPYGLSIKSWKNRGTIVTVSVPLKAKG